MQGPVGSWANVICGQRATSVGYIPQESPILGSPQALGRLLQLPPQKATSAYDC